MQSVTRFFALNFGIVCFMGISSAIHAESVGVDLTVHGGKLDRKNVPVTAIIELPSGAKASSVVEIAVPSGKSIVGQLAAPGIAHGDVAAGDSANRRELQLILPEIKAGQTLNLHGVFKPAGGETSMNGFNWHDVADEHFLLSYGDRPVLDYMCRPLDESSKTKRDETFKPYHHLYDPDGKILVTKGPGGLYPHHRAMFFGYNKVSYGKGKTADVWHCTNNCYQSHEKLLDEEAGPVLGRHCVAIDWHGQDRAAFAHERREMTVYSLPGGSMIDFASHVETAGEKVRLDGDPQNSGFHFRAPQEVADKTSLQTIFIRADGAAKPGDTINWDPKQKTHDPRTINQPWKGMSFVLGGERYTVAMLDLPSNPKEARFSERNYGRFGSYFEYDLTKEHPLDVRYRVWLRKGQMTPEQIAALAADFVEPVACECRLRSE